MKLYYKILDGNLPCHGGAGEYSLPSKRKDGTWKPGKWMPAIKGDLVPCQNGYHLCNKNQLVHWLGPDIYEAEYKGERIDEDNKIVVRQMRLVSKVEAWNDKSARLFACWCVRQVWHLLKDERSRMAVETAERFANGEATRSELIAASFAARNAAMDAAWDAARNAASSAARKAARDAAWDATREAQSKKLIEMLGLE